MNALRVNQFGYVKVVTILSEKKVPTHIELNNMELYLNSLSWAGFVQLS